MPNYNWFFFHEGPVKHAYKRLLLCNVFSSLIGSIEYAIGVQCLFYAMGISTLGSKSVQFLLKDVIGQIIGLGIVNYVKHFTPSQLLWFSTIFLQTGVISDLLLLKYPKYLLLLTCCSTTLKNIGFTLNSTLHIQAMNHSVVQRHIGEAYVSYASASTIAGSVGMGLGIVVTTYSIGVTTVDDFHSIS
jgi:hypothetical protein